MADIRNIMRIGIVSTANIDRREVRVTFPDKDNLVSDELPLLDHIPVPDVGDSVLCLFLPNGKSKGFCIGSFGGDGS